MGFLSGRFRLNRAVFAGLALIAAGLLAVAEFTSLYEVVVGPLDVVRRSRTGSENHSHALLVVAIAVLPMKLVALRAR